MPELASADNDSVEILDGARAAVLNHYKPIFWSEWTRPAGCRQTDNCYRGDHNCELVKGCSDPYVGAERLALIQKLDAVAALLPGDDWIAGQRVAFRVKEGLLDEAARTADECAATQWWCIALRAWVSRQKQESGADSMFLRALALMPADERCRWNSVMEWLPDAPDSSSDLCADSVMLNRFWRLTDPLFLRPGNDRRTEHYARYTDMLLYIGVARALDGDRRNRNIFDAFNWTGPGHRARSAPSWNCIADCTNVIRFPSANGVPMLLRFGWPERFGLVTPIGGGSKVTHFHSGGYEFLPPREVEKSPSDASADWFKGWESGPTRTGPLGLETLSTMKLTGARETYRPTYAAFDRVLHQTALFRRGDSLLIVAKPDFRVVDANRGLGLFTEVESADTPIAHTPVKTDPAGRPVFRVTSRLKPQMLGIEAWADRVAFRDRFGTRDLEHMRGRTGISQALLFSGSATDSSRLENVLDAMLPSTVIRQDTVGVFWEMYGLPRDAPGEIRVQLQRGQSGVSASIRSMLGGTAVAPVVKWQFTAMPDARGIHSMVLSLPIGLLENGDYTLVVGCQCAGGDFSTTRPFVLDR